ncbi:MAG: thioredoxin family protein [Ignavibacteria bacterium]|nr:thioredoxin family protein [Ignavibacteria bacterium]
MTRLTVCLFLAVLILGCGATKETTQEVMLTGWTTRSDFFNGSFPGFQARYDTVQIAPDMVELIADFNDGTDWLVFLGTWCSDSYREVPAFLRIVDNAGIDSTRIRYYGLDRDKMSPGGFEQGYDITRVPTIIFMRDGTEIGRIVERSEPGMEDEMLRILMEGGEE